MTQRTLAARTLALAILLVAAASEPAHASGFLVARFGGEQGHPTTDDPTAIYYNPAGLSLRPGRLRVHVNGVLAWRTASYDRPESAIDKIVESGENGSGTPRSAVGANAGNARLLNFIASPFIAVTSDLGVKNLGVGVAFYAPFGGSAEWKQNEAFANNGSYPGAVDGVQRWSTISGSLRSLYITGAASYRIPQIRLSIGAGVNVIINEINTIRARTAIGTDDLVAGSGALLEGRSLINARGVTASVGLGFIWQPIEPVWLGVSYQSQPGFGQHSLKGEVTNKFGASAVSTQAVEMTQSLPDVLRVGVRYRPVGQVELRLFGEYVRWSVFQNQCIMNADDPKRSCKLLANGAVDTANGGGGVLVNLPRDWKDGFGLRAGASYFVLPTLELFVGGGYDSNAVPTHTLDASLMDMDKLSLSLGARVELVRRRLAIAATYTQVIYFERTVPTRPRDTMGRPNTPPYAPAAPSSGPDGGGIYNQAVGLLSLAAEYSF